MIKNKDGSITLTPTEVQALELIIGEWEESAEDNLVQEGEPVELQNAFIIDFAMTNLELKALP